MRATSSLIIRQLLVCLHRTRQGVSADESAGPAQFDLDAIRVALHSHGDLFQQQPGDCLSILGRCRIGRPQRGQVVRKRRICSRSCCDKLCRAVLLEIARSRPAMFVRADRFIPTPFQLSSHQAMLGIDGRVLPSRLFDFVARTRKSLLPVLVELSPLALDVFSRGQAQLQ